MRPVWAGLREPTLREGKSISHKTRSREGTIVFGALSGAPVALDVDGHDSPTSKAWSVVVKGRADAIRPVQDLMDTVDLPLLPWQRGDKNRFLRIYPDFITGRRFPVATPGIWRTPLSDVRRASTVAPANPYAQSKPSITRMTSLSNGQSITRPMSNSLTNLAYREARPSLVTPAETTPWLKHYHRKIKTLASKR